MNDNPNAMDPPLSEVKDGDPFDMPPQLPNAVPKPEHSSDGEFQSLVQNMVESVNEISSFGEFRRISKTECTNLTRRVKLLAPLFDELREFRGTLPEQGIACFRSLDRALHSSRQLIRSCLTGSKIYMLFEVESLRSKFLSITVELEQALDALPFNDLDISDEVREQVELVHSQLKRAKTRVDAQDMEICSDLRCVLLEENDNTTSTAALERLAEKLQLTSISELKQEASTLQSVFCESNGVTSEKYEQMSLLLARFKDLCFKDDSVLEALDNEKSMQIEKQGAPVVPDDFRCPISLELMKDPVIVATGQTYERACIQKWLDAGNNTCPKTQQQLAHQTLTPNYVLKSLITQWCETHGIEPPKKTAAGDRKVVNILLQKLVSGHPNVQREAAAELRALAKRNAENRVCIAEAGAIPLLVGLLSSPDEGTQEHAVTALLNLSIHEGNKAPIVAAGAIEPIVEVLKHGSMEARENAAATLFSLSVVDENKVLIGASGAIPALVSLLRDGTLRGKKDAATALFNLSIYQGNKARAVRALVVPPLMQLLIDPASEMVDEALAILAILATHQEGRTAISQASAIPVLVDLIKTGSPRNKENAAAVLLALCVNDHTQTAIVLQVGAYGPLSDLAKNGTARARRKATSLLEHLNKQENMT